MIVSTLKQLYKEKITNFCRKWKIKEFAFFGSILRQDFNRESDIDILVTFSEDATWNLLDLVKIQEELEKLFNRKVDLIEKKVIENSSNWIRRQEILSTAKTFYVER